MQWLNDLSITERERALLDLQAYPYFDPEAALFHLNQDKMLVIALLQEFFSQSLPNEKKKLATAFAAQDWDKIEKLTHKIMGGICYLGLIKMHYACQHLERYYNSGHTRLLPVLYQQLIQNFAETEETIQPWILKEQ